MKDEVVSDVARVCVQLCERYELAGVRRACESVLAELGGVERFVCAGQTVLLKPNLLSPRAPVEAVTTHPVVVRALIELCFEAGAGRVWVGDSCAGDHTDERLWEATGMRQAIAGTNAELKSFGTDVTARVLGERRVPVPAWLDEVDVLVSVPKLKTHGLTVITCGVKNMYGMISGSAKAAYHATYPSPRSMSRFLVDVYGIFKPDLCVVDAVVALEGEGPANGRPKHAGCLVGGADAVAVDAVCCGFLGISPERVPMLREAHAKGAGHADTGQIDVTGDAVARLDAVRLKPSIARWLLRIPEPVFKLATRVLRCRPEIDQAACVGCGVCARICSQDAIHCDDQTGTYHVDRAQCIVCLCCAESCPRHAVLVKSPADVLRRVRDFILRR